MNKSRVFNVKEAKIQASLLLKSLRSSDANKVNHPDILASLSAQSAHPFLVGFAAETHDVASYAQGKLRHKGLDMIAANQVGQGLGFETADNALTLYWADGELVLPRASKSELARQLIAQVAARFQATRG